MIPQIVFVDDEQDVLRMIECMLAGQSSEWEKHFFSDSRTAWEFLEHHPVDAIVTDVTMPGISGMDLLERLRSHELTRDVPVTMLTGLRDASLKRKVLDKGATDLLNKPFQSADLLSRLRSMLRLKAAEDGLRDQNRNLEAIVQRRTRQLRQSRLQIILRLAKAGEFRDEDTGKHVVRVALYSRILGQKLGFSATECEELLLAAPLHDIGKIGIPDSILLKPGRLTDEERKVIQTHCEIGERILREPSLTELCVRQDSLLNEGPEDERDSLMETARQIALSHHERWDGRGYPFRLRGKEIPLVARIVAVADVFDALTTDRPYKAALPIDEAVRIITNGVATQFDPAVIDTFLKSLDEVAAVCQQVAQSTQMSPDRSKTTSRDGDSLTGGCPPSSAIESLSSQLSEL